MMKLILGFLALQINCFSEDKPDHNLEVSDLEDVLERLFETEMDKMDKSKAFKFDSVSYLIIPLSLVDEEKGHKARYIVPEESASRFVFF